MQEVYIGIAQVTSRCTWTNMVLNCQESLVATGQHQVSNIFSDPGGSQVTCSLHTLPAAFKSTMCDGVGLPVHRQQETRSRQAELFGVNSICGWSGPQAGSAAHLRDAR